MAILTVWGDASLWLWSAFCNDDWCWALFRVLAAVCVLSLENGLCGPPARLLTGPSAALSPSPLVSLLGLRCGSGSPELWRAGFSLQWLLLGRSAGCRAHRRQQLQCMRLMGSGAQAQQLGHVGLVALWQVGFPRTRDQTSVPCTGRRILNHQITSKGHKQL